MNTRLIRENRLLYNELVESKPINAISNKEMRKKVEKLCRRNYYTLLYSFKFENILRKYKEQIAVCTNSKILRIRKAKKLKIRKATAV